MTLEKDTEDETNAMLSNCNRILKKFNADGGNGQFAVYAQFSNDIQGGDSLFNRDIASELIKRGLLTQKLEPTSIRFLEKADVNGLAMHDLYRVLKRQSDLFVHRYGMASHVREHNSKFLTNRYGEVKHYYAPQVETAVIEADIKKLIAEEFDEAKFERLLNPPREAFQ